MANTKIGARLESVASDGIVAGADAIYDDTLHKSQAQINQGISGLAEKANYVGVVTIGSAPTASTLTYTVGVEQRNFKVGDEVRVADANAETGYKFYKLNALNVTNAGEENETTSAVWQEIGAGSGGGAGTIDYTEEATQITDIDATLATTALRKTAQSLTASEKTQVRTNLGLDSAYIAAATEDNLLKTVAQELSAAQIAQVKTNLYLDTSYVTASDVADVLRSSAQTLTSTQKTQVKTNLDLDSSYLTIAAQSLTAAQKTQVKTNLGITEYDASQTRSITFSTSEPTSSDGSDGDIWIVYEEPAS